MALRAVFFDLDRTLWSGGHFRGEAPDWDEITRLQAQALAPEFERLGLSHPDLIDFVTRFWPVFGLADQAPNLSLAELRVGAIIRECLRRDGFKCSDADGECLWEAMHIPFHYFGTEPFPDAIAAVERLRDAGMRLAVLTNRPVGGHILQRELTALGFPDAFEAIVTSGEVGYRKPHPLVFETALRHLDLPPADVLMVGDSYENDVVPAAKLGMTAVLKLNESEPDAAAYGLAAHQVASLDALLQLDLLATGRSP
jgi:HAD superfamily hydrolase (TIGR01549 family)